MDNAVALAPNATPVAATFAGRLQAMPLRSKVSAVIGVAALAAVVFAMTAWNAHGDYKVLYANLSDKDGGAVIAQLSQMNVPYRMSEGGAAILVPAAQVHDLRLKMATAGLPKGAVSGFELMDSARFGQTQFQERLTFQRGLEGELTRSISSLAAVEAARVHLALPNQNGFFREQQKPSASVLLTLHPGRTLDRAQVAGIVHLVSSSVPEMSPKAVSVLDQSGTLLTGGGDGAPGGAGLDAQQLAYVNQIEAGYTKRILDLVEPIVGHDNLRASVTAEVDFSQTEATSEEFKPNQGADASISIRSQQTTEQGGGAGSSLPSGVPGAASNQPPIAATAPLTGASQPLQGAPTTAVGGSGGRREAVTNYEIDKTVRVTRSATGNVKRLNAALVVNNRSITDAKGKTTQIPLTAEEIEKITAVVRESIGFNQERGDSVKVVNAPFKVESMSSSTGGQEPPFWKSPELIDMVRAAALPVGLAIIGILVFFGLVRPAVKTALSPQPAPLPRPGMRIDAVVDDEQAYPTPAIAAPPTTLRQIEGAKTLAKDNPAAV
ncbi:MAG TPA: flagellar basal-body MS-ring/collar protein FliF, partial [Caldimonas sp.]